jgi:hypothetical protein
MVYEYSLYSASGFAIDRCCFLGQRKEKGEPFAADRSETWVLTASKGKGADPIVFDGGWGLGTWLTMLWVSPKGVAYVSELDEHVWRSEKPAKFEAWKEYAVPATLAGVWGLDDSNVFAWGVGNGGPKMFRWNGSKWSEMDSPGEVARMHGLSKEHILAVGAEGLLARFDGKRWTQIPLRTGENLMGVHVAGPDEFHACGEGGNLLEGSRHGWRERARMDHPLLDVAKFEGSVFVAGGEEGLLSLKGKTNRLAVIKPNIKATSFDARERLIISCNDKICESIDGKGFISSAQGVLEELVETKEPLWLK